MILETIANATRVRVAKAKQQLSLEELKERIGCNQGITAIGQKEAFAFEKALRKDRGSISFICEVKKASPSKGVIAEKFRYMDIAKEYEEAGADAVSVLTEPEFFLGKDKYLTQISQRVQIPVLRKDFTVDEYQIYEARALGADAVLLICSLLETQCLRRYLAICDALGLSALVEAHNEEEIRSALSAGARIIGVNNRNLKTFEVDFNHCIKLRGLVPPDIIYVAESGIKSAEDIRMLIEEDVNAVLIGETLMRSDDKKEQLKQLRMQ